MSPTFHRFSLLFLAAVVTSRLRADNTSNGYVNTVRPLLMTYCSDCHSPDDDEDVVGFLKATEVAGIGQRREVWSSATEQLHNRTMPPADLDQPTEAERLQLSTWINEYLESSACNGKAHAGDPMPR